MQKYDTDVIIVGAGPAGISAALYLLRGGISCILFEKESPGGNVNKSFRVENYPGYEGVDGPSLAFNMYDQIKKLNVVLKTDAVTMVKTDADKVVVSTSKAKYTSRYLIIASGKAPRKLDVMNAFKYDGKGISYCAICDGNLYKNKDVIIIGGGNSAAEAALYLSKIAKNMTLINRTSKLKAYDKEQDDLERLKNLTIINDAVIKKIMDDNGKLTGVKLDDGRIIDGDGIFVCIGQDRNSGYYQSLNIKSDKNGIVVDKNMMTSNEKVYACGDAVSKRLYQIVTAASEGAIAATAIIDALMKKNSA